MGLWADAKNIRDKDPAARNVAEVIILGFIYFGNMFKIDHEWRS